MSVGRRSAADGWAKRRIAMAVLLVLVAAAYLSRAWWLEGLGRYLVYEQEPERADAVVVLSGSFPDRILEAVALYSDGWAQHVLLCREPENQAVTRLKRKGVDVLYGYERNRSVAEQLGVPARAVEIVDRSGRSTFGEAGEVLRYAYRRGYRSVLLVTSKLHTRRASLIYRRLAGDSMRIISRPARDDPYDPATWWRNRTMVRRVVIEYEKLLVFLLIDGWRAGPVLAGSPAT
jgi:uncharacterized SAM-binding protein YcdF (DUF218 family)